MRTSARSTSVSTFVSDVVDFVPAMKQTLQLKLSQHLTLTPQLQQSIRLLQLSTIELNAEVERLLQENPFSSGKKATTTDLPRNFRWPIRRLQPRRSNARRERSVTATD